MTQRDRNGERFGKRYRLMHKLCDTSLGEKHLATHVDFGRSLEIEVVSQEIIDADPTFERRFMIDVGACASVVHPGIATVHEHGRSAAGELYLVTTHFSGKLLHDVLLAEGVLPIDRALDIALGIGRALRHAHNNGVVHRGVEPKNIVLEGDNNGEERPILLNLGVASLLDSSGDRADPRVDVFGLGMLLDRMLPEGNARNEELVELIQRAVDGRHAARFDAMLPMVAAIEQVALHRKPAPAAHVYRPLGQIIAPVEEQAESEAETARAIQIENEDTVPNKFPVAAPIAAAAAAAAIAASATSSANRGAPLAASGPIAPAVSEAPARPIASEPAPVSAERAFTVPPVDDRTPPPAIRAAKPRRDTSVIAEIVRGKRPWWAAGGLASAALVATLFVNQSKGTSETRIAPPPPPPAAVEQVVEAPAPAPAPVIPTPAPDPKPEVARAPAQDPKPIEVARAPATEPDRSRDDNDKKSKKNKRDAAVESPKTSSPRAALASRPSATEPARDADEREEKVVEKRDEKPAEKAPEVAASKPAEREVAPAPAKAVEAPKAAEAAKVEPPKSKNVAPNVLDQELVHRVDFKLPASVRAQIQGQKLDLVVLVCTTTSGEVDKSRTRIIKSLAGTDNLVLEAVRQWRYRPQPVPLCAPVRFDVNVTR